MSAPEISGLDSDILNGFKEESTVLLGELTTVVEKLEGPTDGFPSELMEEFSQKIDRIMGAAKTLLVMDPEHLGLLSIGKISEICKAMGYRAAGKGIVAMVPLVAAFWGDTIEVLEDFLEALENREKTISIAKTFSPILQKRLEWLLNKLGPASANELMLGGKRDGSSASGIAPVSDQVTAEDFVNLLKELGIK